MKDKFLLATYVEGFCKEMREFFKIYRDDIDALKIKQDDNREELLFVLLAQKLAVKTDENHIILVRQFVHMVCNSTYLQDDFEEVPWQPDFFDKYD